MHHGINSEAVHYEHLRKALVESFPDIDDETLADTLEGESNLADLLAEVVRSSMEDRTLSSALRDRMRQMRERLERLDARAEKKRTIVRQTMARAGLPRLVEPDFTVSVSASPVCLIVTDDSAIPSEYWLPQPDKLDRHALLTVLKDGTQVLNAALSNGETKLTVRTK